VFLTLFRLIIIWEGVESLKFLFFTTTKNLKMFGWKVVDCALQKKENLNKMFGDLLLMCMTSVSKKKKNHCLFYVF
jgi:hypothetical protein